MSNPLLRFTFPLGRIVLIDPVKLRKNRFAYESCKEGKGNSFFLQFLRGRGNHLVGSDTELANRTCQINSI
jgi:hypothetical protein